jgi:hypothetical protein
MSRRKLSFSPIQARVPSWSRLVRPSAARYKAEVAHRPHQRVVLEERAVLLERLLEVGGLVRRAEAAPGDKVRAGRDGRGRVDLQQGQLLHDREQLGGPGCVEQLRAHRDAPGLRLGEPVHAQEATSGCRIVAWASPIVVRMFTVVVALTLRRSPDEVPDVRLRRPPADVSDDLLS